MVTPMQPIRIALVGVGRIADLHAQAYTHDPRATLWALCDRDEELLARRADEWGVERTFTDYADLLADPDVQAVEILTPTSLHCEQVLAAAAAGKHISVQKPMALSMEDGRRMVDACERAGVVYKVCENYVFYPPLQRARVLIDGGAIGRVLSVGMRMVGAGSGGWPVAADSWRWRLEEAKVAGGPTVFDHGHHMYSCGWYLGGRIDKLHAWIHHVDAVVDSPATVQWAYEDGLAQGSVQFVMCPELEVESPYYSNDEWFEIAGTRGLIWVNSCTAEFRPGLPAVTLQTSDGVQHIDDLDSDWAAGFTGALRNFGSSRPCCPARRDWRSWRSTWRSSAPSASSGRCTWTSYAGPTARPSTAAVTARTCAPSARTGHRSGPVCSEATTATHPAVGS